MVLVEQSVKLILKLMKGQIFDKMFVSYNADDG